MYIVSSISTIGSSIPDFYQNINVNWISIDRSKDKDKDKDERQILSEQFDVQSEPTRRRTKAEKQYEDRAKENWEILNQYYAGEFKFPNRLLSLPPKDFALRNLYTSFIDEVLVPEMWLKSVSYPGKPSLTCIFEVQLLTQIETFSLGFRRRKEKIND